MSTVKLTTASGGGTVSLTAPSSTTSNAQVVLTLPQNDGDADQYLQTNGSGTLSFATVSGGVTSDGDNNTVAGTDAGNVGTWSGAQNNTCVGHDAGTSITSGDSNTAVGADALKDLSTASHVTAIGYKAHENGTGGENVAVGSYAMGVGVTTATYNVCIGNGAGKALTDGEANTLIGFEAGVTGSGADRNTFIGFEAGKACTSNDHVCVGRQAGKDLTSSSGNTLIGERTALGLTDGSYNVCLGNQAGANQIGASDTEELFIAHSDTGPAHGNTWIYGAASGACTQGNNSSSWTTTSDQRLKKDITDNTVGLSVIDNIKVRNFKYKQYNKTPAQYYEKSDTEVQNGTKTTSDIKVARSYTPVSSDDVVDVSQFPKAEGDVGKVLIGQGVTGVQLGVIAQELESVAPNCIITSSKGVKTVDTDELFWHMLNAIKELSTKVKALEAG